MKNPPVRVPAGSLSQGDLFQPTGLTLPEGWSFDRWAAFGHDVLTPMAKGLQWWVGDWLLYGERNYGEQYAEAMNVTGLDYGTVANYQWVAGAVPFSLRKESLTWSHHFNVAGLEPKSQKDWLDRAEKEGWSSNELRQAIRDAKVLLPPKLPKGSYRVLYADPPWSYNNSGFDQSAASHYPTLATDAICALELPKLGADAVLFLWVTSPLLPDGVRVVDAWGFQYKASMVWQKDRAPGLGWFLHTKHELLLIGTRGEAQPNTKLDSVFSAPVGKHSAKPHVVYDFIEQMYDGPYCELFLRGVARDGWAGWGNEAAA